MQSKKGALRAGVCRVLGGKRYVLLVYLCNVALVAIPALVVADSIERSLGHGGAGERMLQGFDPDWYGRFQVDAQGFASTFRPAVAGIGAVFEGLDEFLSGRFPRENRGILAIALLYVLLWSFAAAGLVWRYGRPRREGSFLAQCARFFPRFLILAILAGALYWLVFTRALPALADVVRRNTRDLVDERIAFGWTLVKYIALGAMLCAVNLLFGYAKIITVLRGRRLVIFTPLEALWFVVRHPLRTIGLYLALGILGCVLVALYWLYWYLAPDANQETLRGILLALGVGQLFILGRILLKCLFLGSQTALYERFTPAAAPAASAAPQPEPDTQREPPPPFEAPGDYHPTPPFVPPPADAEEP